MTGGPKVILLKRQTALTARELNGDSILLHAQMKDEVHLMDVQLVVNTVSGEVVSAFATMGQAPYGEECFPAIAAIKNLIGLKVAHGAAAEIFRRVGGEQGCAHLAELCVTALWGYVPALGMSAMLRWQEQFEQEGLTPREALPQVMEEIRKLGQKTVPGTCMVYRRDSPPENDPDGGQ